MKMKKILIAIVFIVILFIIVIIGIHVYKNSKEYSFYATILEVSSEDKKILVNITDNENEGIKGKMYVYLNNTKILNSNGKSMNISDLRVNDIVIITMSTDEPIVATNPGKLLNILKVKIVK